MKTVDKALRVLDQFSVTRTEIGLSELARLAGLDKAATRRLLLAMAKHGFVEQNEGTRKYRLGHGFLRLARIREATMPLTRTAEDVAEKLTFETGESVHISVPAAQGMTIIAQRMPQRSMVIQIPPAQMLPFHASASGLAYLAFVDDVMAADLLTLERPALTKQTVTDRAKLEHLREEIRQLGYAQARDTLERDVGGLAMPFYQDGANPVGCIAVALPSAEMTDQRKDALLPSLRGAITAIERAMTGF